MAGGSWEYMAGCISGYETSIFGNNLTVADISKYINSYTNTANSNINYDGAIVGDATKETKNWNSDNSSFVTNSNNVFRRGGVYGDGTDAGIFAFYGLSSSGAFYNSFRPVFVNL